VTYSVLIDSNAFIIYLLLFSMTVMVAEIDILETNLIPKNM